MQSCMGSFIVAIEETNASLTTANEPRASMRNTYLYPLISYHAVVLKGNKHELNIFVFPKVLQISSPNVLECSEDQLYTLLTNFFDIGALGR